MASGRNGKMTAVARGSRRPHGKRVSQFYELGVEQPSLEFLDVVLKQDTRLFVDPRAFMALTSDWGDACVDLIRQFFGEVLNAIREGDEDRARLLLDGLHEPNETRLGFTKGRVAGRGVGPGLADDLYASLSQSEAVRADGLIQELEDASLLIPGFGVDLVSDITTNIVRRQLIDFTVATAEKYGMKLEDDVDSGALWSPKTGQWQNEQTRMLAPYGKPLILVPRAVARWRLDYDPGEYYRHHVLSFLKGRELEKTRSALVHVIRTGPRKGERDVYKKDIERREKRRQGDGSKTIAVRTTLKYPQVLDQYRRAKERTFRPPDSIEFLAEKVGTARPNWSKLLKDVLDCKRGSADATKYHRAVEALLTALFEPSLVDPQLEKEIAARTKRVDIRYRNMARGGFFRWFTDQHEKAPWISVECKNYNADPKNDQLAQIAGRLTKRRGRLGLLVCREIKDRKRFLLRCREELHNQDRYILGLDDEILTLLVAARKADDSTQFSTILSDLVDELVD
jgi:hypothetical protein